MQLPRRRAEKGWIKLDLEDGLRVVAKMRSLMEPGRAPIAASRHRALSSLTALEPYKHRYHLTLDDEGKPTWIYTLIDFQPTLLGLRATAPILLKPEVDHQVHNYNFEANWFGNHYLISSQRADGTSDMCVELFPNVATDKDFFVGARINNSWYKSTVVSSITILSRSRIERLESVEPGPIDANGSAILESKWAKYSEIVRLPGPVASSVQCEHVGDDEAALRYLVEKYRSPDLVKLRDIHGRAQDYIPYDRDTYEAIRLSIEAFLRRRDTHIDEVVGTYFDEQLIHSIASGVDATVGAESRRFDCYRLKATMPVMSYVLLEYKGGHREVLFGWGRQSISRPDEAVFRSSDPRLVAEFSTFYDVLCSPDFSTRISIIDLRGGTLAR
jgi:hypothetical protein